MYRFRLLADLHGAALLTVRCSPNENFYLFIYFNDFFVHSIHTAGVCAKTFDIIYFIRRVCECAIWSFKSVSNQDENVHGRTLADDGGKKESWFQTPLLASFAELYVNCSWCMCALALFGFIVCMCVRCASIFGCWTKVKGGCTQSVPTINSKKIEIIIVNQIEIW